MKPHLLVVDDEPDIRELLQEILEDEGFDVETAENGSTARAARRNRRPDLVLLDIWMPDVDGITLLKEWHEAGDSDAPVIMMSGHGTVETAVEATRLGAYDFIEKPLSIAKLMLTVRNAMSAAHLGRENRVLKRETALGNEPVGKSRVMEEVRDSARRAAAHDAPVLITGESGSGKAALARYLHQHSDRQGGEFVRLSVAALSHADGAAQLFGFESGGNVRYGALESANSGLLFLEDVADLDAALQTRLVGALHHQRFQRVGGSEDVALAARLVAASTHDLPALVREGQFRDDLYYLLNVVPLAVPPLRERTEDLPELLEQIVQQLVDNDHLPYRRFTVASQNRLRHYPWPGNTRELTNLVQRLLILGRTDVIDTDEIDAALEIPKTALAGAVNTPAVQTAAQFDLPIKEARERYERAYLEHHLRATDGSVSKVAKAAGMERTHLYRKLRQLGIDVKNL
jgi:DNA-binding NtrC family response regulator